jgi:hypothetical protein
MVEVVNEGRCQRGCSSDRACMSKPQHSSPMRPGCVEVVGRSRQRESNACKGKRELRCVSFADRCARDSLPLRVEDSDNSIGNLKMPVLRERANAPANTNGGFEWRLVRQGASRFCRPARTSKHAAIPHRLQGTRSGDRTPVRWTWTTPHRRRRSEPATPSSSQSGNRQARRRRCKGARRSQCGSVQAL